MVFLDSQLKVICEILPLLLPDFLLHNSRVPVDFRKYLRRLSIRKINISTWGAHFAYPHFHHARFFLSYLKRCSSGILDIFENWF